MDGAWQYDGKTNGKQIADTLYWLDYVNPDLTLHGSDGTASTVQIEARVVTYRLEMPAVGVVQLKGSDGSMSQVVLPCCQPISDGGAAVRFMPQLDYCENYDDSAADNAIITPTFGTLTEVEG